MKLLTRYILKQFFKNLFMLVACFIAIYVLIDFFEKIDNFMEKGKSMALVGKFFLLNIPFIIEQMGPVCILLAGVITLGILNHSNELIALKACGIPLRRITGPILGAALGVTVLFLLMSQFVLPRTNAETDRIWNREVKGRVSLGIFRNGRYYYRGQEGFYSFVRPDPRSSTFLSFSYTSWTPDYRLKTLIAAEKARWDRGQWTLYRGQVQQLREDRGQDYRSEIFSQRDFAFPEQPSSFFVSRDRDKELSLTGLYRESRIRRAPEDRLRALTAFYGRISYILLGIPLLLVGLPLLLFVYRRWGRDLSLAIPVSCGLAFGCWGIWGTLQSLAKAGYISPLLAATAIHLTVGSLGLGLLLREDS